MTHLDDFDDLNDPIHVIFEISVSWEISINSWMSSIKKNFDTPHNLMNLLSLVVSLSLFLSSISETLRIVRISIILSFHVHTNSTQCQQTFFVFFEFLQSWLSHFSWHSWKFENLWNLDHLGDVHNDKNVENLDNLCNFHHLLTIYSNWKLMSFQMLVILVLSWWHFQHFFVSVQFWHHLTVIFWSSVRTFGRIFYLSVIWLSIFFKKE